MNETKLVGSVMRGIAIIGGGIYISLAIINHPLLATVVLGITLAITCSLCYFFEEDD